MCGEVSRGENVGIEKAEVGIVKNVGRIGEVEAVETMTGESFQIFRCGICQVGLGNNINIKSPNNILEEPVSIEKVEAGVFKNEDSIEKVEAIETRNGENLQIFRCSIGEVSSGKNTNIKKPNDTLG